MSFLFGGGPGHVDPQLTESNRRYREHIARDINDERVLASRGESPMQHRRRTPWVLLAAVGSFFLLVAFLRGGTNEQLAIARSCSQPSVAVASTTVQAGSNFQVRSTGPQDLQYVLTLAGEPVQGQPDVQVPFTSTPAGPAYSLIDCVSPSFLVQAPVRDGMFELTLIEYGAAGAKTVATLELTVVG